MPERKNFELLIGLPNYVPFHSSVGQRSGCAGGVSDEHLAINKLR
jgi:hypothetical protein